MCFCFSGPIKPLYETINPMKRTDVLSSSTRTRNKWRAKSISSVVPLTFKVCYAGLVWCCYRRRWAICRDGHGIVITYPCWLLNYLCVYLRPPYQTDAVPLIELTRRNPWTIGYCDNLLIVSYSVYMWLSSYLCLASINHSRQKNRRWIDFTLLYIAFCVYL